MINKIDLRKAISSIAISNAKRNTIYKAFSDLDSITKEEFDSVKSDISKVVESMLTKDTVGKANGVASLDSNGNVPIEQLSNIDTILFLIVRELPTTDIKTNKIYLVPNQDGQGNNVYIEYLYVEGVWEKVGEFKPEVSLSEYVKSNDIYQCIKKEYDSSKRGKNAIAIDDSAQAIGTYSTALGYGAQTTCSESTALGSNSQANADSSTALGYGAQATGSFSIALGYSSQAKEDSSTALGNSSQAIGDTSTALGYGAVATGDYSIAVGNSAQATKNYSIAIGDNVQAKTNWCIALGSGSQATGNSAIALGHDTQAISNYAIGLGNNAQANNNYTIALGHNTQATGSFSIALGNRAKSKGFGAIALGFAAITSTVSKYALGGYDDNKKVEFNIEEITYSQYGNKKYLIGLGGYDGTNITTNNENGEEVLNPNIKSVQEIINSKANKTDVNNRLDNCVKIGDDNTPTQLFKGQGIATVNAQQLILGSPSGSVNIQPNSINVNSSSFTFKANSTEGLGFIANTVSKGVILTPQGGVNSIGFDAKNANVDIGGSLVGQNTAGAVYNVDGNFVNLNPLYNFKAKFENSIVLNSALNNITAATTAEEVVTKFNALLADLKNKGFMEADTPQ